MTGVDRSEIDEIAANSKCSRSGLEKAVSSLKSDAAGWNQL